VIQARKRISTETQGFGVSKRESHDSSRFYSRKLYDQTIANNEQSSDDHKYRENSIEPQNLNKLFCQSSEKMDELPENSVHLMVTSPPYYVDKDYDQDEYKRISKSAEASLPRDISCPCLRWQSMHQYRKFRKKTYIPLHSYIIEDMHEVGFLMRGEIIWNKTASSGISTAWGVGSQHLIQH